MQSGYCKQLISFKKAKSNNALFLSVVTKNIFLSMGLSRCLPYTTRDYSNPTNPIVINTNKEIIHCFFSFFKFIPGQEETKFHPHMVEPYLLLTSHGPLTQQTRLQKLRSQIQIHTWK